MLFLFVVIATVFIQIPNVLAIKAFDGDPSFKHIFMLTLICLPATFFSSLFFNLYYGKGYEFYSYPVIAVMAYGTGLITTSLVQVFVLKSKTLNPYEIIGGLIIMFGIALIVSKR